MHKRPLCRSCRRLDSDFSLRGSCEKMSLSISCPFAIVSNTLAHLGPLGANHQGSLNCMGSSKWVMDTLCVRGPERHGDSSFKLSSLSSSWNLSDGGQGKQSVTRWPDQEDDDNLCSIGYEGRSEDLLSRQSQLNIEESRPLPTAQDMLLVTCDQITAQDAQPSIVLSSFESLFRPRAHRVILKTHLAAFHMPCSFYAQSCFQDPLVLHFLLFFFVFCEGF